MKLKSNQPIAFNGFKNTFAKKGFFGFLDKINSKCCNVVWSKLKKASVRLFLLPKYIQGANE